MRRCLVVSSIVFLVAMLQSCAHTPATPSVSRISPDLPWPPNPVPHIPFLDYLPETSSTIRFAVTITDPEQRFGPYGPQIADITRAAAAQWGALLQGDGEIHIEVYAERNTATAHTASTYSAFVHASGLSNVYQQGMTSKLNGGPDANGDGPDLRIGLNPGYLHNDLWLDPKPFERTEPVPAHLVDAVSVMIHEIGHAVAMTGWLGPDFVDHPTNFLSTYDRHVRYDGKYWWFDGPRTKALLGGNALPLHGTIISHYANPLPGPGAKELAGGIMCGLAFRRGHRYNLSLLEAAILDDCSVPLKGWVQEKLERNAPAMPQSGR